MRVAMIGTGYVGLVSGACFSQFGHYVTCVDSDVEKIDAIRVGQMPIFEPGLEDMVVNNIKGGRLTFTGDLKTAVSGVDAVFIAVGTPGEDDGSADMSFVFSAVEEIAQALKGYTVIATKSTVPVGTGKKIAEIIKRLRPNQDFGVVSNPEFLREGSAIEDFMRPDRVVIGANSDKARELMRELYRPLYLIQTPILFTSPESAELIKYAANTFLATKITFINEIADLCERLGADIHEIARGIGLDGRIGSKFLHAGPGYGGSCFPKDTRALVAIAQKTGSPLQIVETVVRVNNERKQKMVSRIIAACGNSVREKKIAILGLTFKPNTDDMRESPSIEIVSQLLKAGAYIFAYDPEGMDEAKKIDSFAGTHWCDNAYETLNDASALIIITEWNEFRALDLALIKEKLKRPLIIDLRNIYEPEEMITAGFEYLCVGRTSQE